MWFPGAVLAATIGSLTGALLLYGIGHWFGDHRLRRLVHRYGRWFGVKEADLDKIIADRKRIEAENQRKLDDYNETLK